MTNEEQKIYDAAKRYVQVCTEPNLARLVTAVMDLPLNQWPVGACPPNRRPEHLLKSQYTAEIVRTAVKLEPGDAAYLDRIIDLETGKKETPQ